MNIGLVDPRDVVIESEPEAYRVYFWSKDGSRSEEHELEGAHDLHEVLGWAESNAEGRVAEIFVRHQLVGGRGLIRLAGSRPGHT